MTHPQLGRLLEHDSGRSRPANRREVPEGELAFKLHTTDDDEARALGALRAYLDERARRSAAGERVGRPPHHCVEFVMQGAGRYAGAEDGFDYWWPREKEERFERWSEHWARDIVGPESLVAVVCGHRDEATHHVHIVAIPIHDGKLGWSGVRDAAIKRIEDRRAKEAEKAGKPPPTRRKGQRRYTLLQDDFHERVGRAFELGRGDRSNAALHEAIDRKAAFEDAIKAERAKAERYAEMLDAAGRVVAEHRERAEMHDAARRVVAKHRADEAAEEAELRAVVAQGHAGQAQDAAHDARMDAELAAQRLERLEREAGDAEERARVAARALERDLERRRSLGRNIAELAAQLGAMRGEVASVDRVLAEKREAVGEATAALDRLEKRRAGVFNRLLERATRFRQSLRSGRRRRTVLEAEIEAKARELEVRTSRIGELDGLVIRTRKAACDEELKRAAASDAKLLAQAEAEKAEARRRDASVDAVQVIRAIYHSFQFLRTALPERVLGAFGAAIARNSGRPVVDLEAELRREHKQKELGARLRAGLRDSPSRIAGRGLG